MELGAFDWGPLGPPKHLYFQKLIKVEIENNDYRQRHKSVMIDMTKNIPPESAQIPVSRMRLKSL